MFFIGIFGIDRKNEKVKELHDTECRECTARRCFLYKEYYRFHFFFITVFTWGRKFTVVCENCSSVFSVAEDKDSYTYWDLNNLLSRGQFSYSSSAHSDSFDSRSNLRENVCPDCGAETKDSWKYCPACGRKL